LHSRYLIDVQGQEEIIGLRKQQISLMFFTKSKIGFTKIQEKSVSSNFCESVSDYIFNFCRVLRVYKIWWLTILIQELYMLQQREAKFTYSKLPIKAIIWNANPEEDFKLQPLKVFFDLSLTCITGTTPSKISLDS